MHVANPTWVPFSEVAYSRLAAFAANRGLSLRGALVAVLNALDPPGRYYSPEEDALLLAMGPEAEEHRTTGVGRGWALVAEEMGRSTPPALRARFLKLEPLDTREQRTGVTTGRSARAKRRPCMICEKPFESEGHHNRLCDNCRQLW